MTTYEKWESRLLSVFGGAIAMTLFGVIKHGWFWVKNHITVVIR